MKKDLNALLKNISLSIFSVIVLLFGVLYFKKQEEFKNIGEIEGFFWILIYTFFSLFINMSFILMCIERIALMKKNKKHLGIFFFEIFLILIAIIFVFACHFTLIYQSSEVSFTGIRDTNIIVQFFNFFYFSWTIFFTVNFGDIVPVNLLARLFSMIEISTGFIIIVYIISNYQLIRDSVSRRYMDEISKDLN